MALIEFRGVKKAFGRKVVYRDLNLEIREREVLTIIGGSGQGKSVMLKHMIGLIRPDALQRFFADADARVAHGQRQHLAVAFRAHRDRSLVRELRRVAQQIDEHLR